MEKEEAEKKERREGELERSCCVSGDVMPARLFVQTKLKGVLGVVEKKKRNCESNQKIKCSCAMSNKVSANKFYLH